MPHLSDAAAHLALRVRRPAWSSVKSSLFLTLLFNINLSTIGVLCP